MWYDKRNMNKSAMKFRIPSFGAAAGSMAVAFSMLAFPSFAKDPNPNLQKNFRSFRLVFFDEKVVEVGQKFQVAGLNSKTASELMEFQDSYAASAVNKSSAVDPLMTFEIKLDDESLSLALRRWAAEAGHQLVWDAGKDFLARATIYDAPNIIRAVEDVMKDTQNSSYPLHACAYANKVIRVLHISQACQRSLK